MFSKILNLRMVVDDTSYKVDLWDGAVSCISSTMRQDWIYKRPFVHARVPATYPGLRQYFVLTEFSG